MRLLPPLQILTPTPWGWKHCEQLSTSGLYMAGMSFSCAAASSPVHSVKGKACRWRRHISACHLTANSHPFKSLHGYFASPSSLQDHQVSDIKIISSCLSSVYMVIHSLCSLEHPMLSNGQMILNCFEYFSK